MSPRLLSATLLITAGALLQGCVSSALQTTLPPRAETHPGISGLKYSFSEVRVKKTFPKDKFGGEPAEIIPSRAPVHKAQPANPEVHWDDETWRRHLTDVAVRRHPALFTRDEPSVPLRVTIDATVDNSLGYSITAEVCTLCILAGVLPLPVYADADIAVSLSADSREATAPTSFEFKREDSSWISVFTPLALIPYPARSDFPRVSLMLPQMTDQAAMEKMAAEVYDYTLESVVEGIVRTIEKDPKAFGTRLSRPRAIAAPAPAESVPDTGAPSDSRDTIPI